MRERNHTVNEARFSLMVHGQEIDAEAVEAGLGLKATRMTRKGEIINRLPLIEAKEDEWVYAVPLTAHRGTDAALNDLLARLVERDVFMVQLKEKYQVTLRLHVQSDTAQMAYQLMPETLEKIVATGLPLDVSSLSWGEVRM